MQNAPTGEPLDGNPQNTWKSNPHVQSYVVATDQLGLSILQQDRRVFGCHSDLHAGKRLAFSAPAQQRRLADVRCHDETIFTHTYVDAAIYHAELGSSAAILRAGYSIDTLMTRWAST